jgi:peptidoglycan/LPS O-acetylase OafA/YrhL
MSQRTVGGVHWPELDGLRALAILLVMARHSLRPVLPHDTYAPVATLGSFDFTAALLNGWIGVDLFFVLSGFLIGRQAWRRDSLARFWFKRVTRILPAYWACLVVVALLITAGGRWSTSRADFLAHVVMLQDYTGSVFVPAFWSLGAEEKFYLLAPAFVVLVARCRQRVMQACALAALWLLPIAFRVIAAWQVEPGINYGDYFARYRSPFHLTCESLVLGFTIAWISLNASAFPALQRRRTRELLFWSGTAAVLWFLVPAEIVGSIDLWTIIVPPAVIGIGFAAIVLAAVSGPGSYSQVLGWRGWRPVATGSYTLYLTHMMAIPVAQTLAELNVDDGRSLTAQWLAFLPWYVAVSSLAAFALHRLVERPVLAWRDRYLESFGSFGTFGPFGSFRPFGSFGRARTSRTS